MSSISTQLCCKYNAILGEGSVFSSSRSVAAPSPACKAEISQWKRNENEKELRPYWLGGSFTDSTNNLYVACTNLRPFLHAQLAWLKLSQTHCFVPPPDNHHRNTDGVGSLEKFKPSKCGN